MGADHADARARRLGDRGRDEINDAVHSAVRELRGRGLHVHEEIRRGEPALVIADVAEEEGARLVVVGSGQRSGAVRRILGSTADDVAHRSPCDTLIVRPRVPRDAAGEDPAVAAEG